jgi:hypothetical protein
MMKTYYPDLSKPDLEKPNQGDPPGTVCRKYGVPITTGQIMAYFCGAVQMDWAVLYGVTPPPLTYEN